MKKILIIGYYGHYNSGDDAILTSICHDIRGLKTQTQITVLSNNPEATAHEYQVNGVYRFDFRKVIRAIQQADILIMGGGTLLQDLTSNRSLYYYLFILWYAKKVKKQVMLFANGIGPIHRGFNRFLTKKIVNQVDAITLREHLSDQVLTSLKVTKPHVEVTADPVYALPIKTIDVGAIFQKENIAMAHPFVAVLFRSWKHEDGYVRKMASVCDSICEQFELDILLVPMKYPSDLIVSGEIIKKMKHKAYLIEGKYDANTLIHILGEAKLVLSMRLHALLYASLMKRPMIGFSYDPKVSYYLEELGMYDAGKTDHIHVNDVLEHVKSILENYDDVVENLNERVLQLKQKAARNKIILERLLKEEELR